MTEKKLTPEEIEIELEDIIQKCRELEEKCKDGYAVFYPVEEEVYLYDMLVKKRVMIKNPIGGYSFAEADAIWNGVPRTQYPSVKKGEYQDDDGVLQVYKDDKGNVVKTVTEKDVMQQRRKNGGS